MKLYELIKDVIKAKNFKKDDMVSKIERAWYKGDITEEEHSELLSLVTKNLNPEAERPEWLEVAAILKNKISALEERVAKLEIGETSSPEEAPKWEKWEKWDGISKKYQFGAIVEHNGIVYENILQNMQNTWEPGTPGTVNIWKARPDLAASEVSA